jgi:hypothetical protein
MGCDQYPHHYPINYPGTILLSGDQDDSHLLLVEIRGSAERTSSVRAMRVKRSM